MMFVNVWVVLCCLQVHKVHTCTPCRTKGARCISTASMELA
jgi:hypothetical protein